MFKISVPVRYYGKSWTAISFDHRTSTYQLRGDYGQIVAVTARKLEVAA
jgi:hypothetical protein